MLFRDDDDDDSAYDYVHPQGILSLVNSPGAASPAGPSPGCGASEAKARRISAQRRERTAYFQTHDENELVDFGLPKLRPRMPLPKPPDPNATEVINRPESPTPVIPPRQPSFSRGAGRGSAYRPVPKPGTKTPPKTAPKPSETKSKKGDDVFGSVINEFKKLPRSTIAATKPIAKEIPEETSSQESSSDSDDSYEELPDCKPPQPARSVSEPSASLTQKKFPEPKVPERKYSAPNVTTIETTCTQSSRMPLGKKLDKISIRREPDGGFDICSKPEVNHVADDSKIKTWADVPSDTKLIKSRADVKACLILLGMEKHIPAFESTLIDGELLQELDESILKDELNISGLNAKKLMKFANGWRPDMS